MPRTAHPRMPRQRPISVLFAAALCATPVLVHSSGLHAAPVNPTPAAPAAEATRPPRRGSTPVPAAATPEAPTPGSEASSPNPDSAVVRNGTDVNVELVVRYAHNKIGKDQVYLRSYNGGLVGPTIRVRPGDTLNVHLINKLPVEPPYDPKAHPKDDPSYPHSFNSTNLHTHGMHVSPSGNADNVMLNIAPGQDFHYEIKIPADHPAGTYWYHPHRHGSTAIQVASGMEGALIVEGDIDRVPEIAAAKERIFVFQQIGYQKEGEKPGEVEQFKAFTPGFWLLSGRPTTINGEAMPTIEMQPGEIQRWRFIDAGVSETLKLKLEGEDGRTIPQHLFSMDGITTGRLEAQDATEMYPGYRADVLVQAGDKEETWLLVDQDTMPIESLHMLREPRRILARIHVAGPKMSMKLPDPGKLAPLAPYKSISDSEITGHQKVEFGVVGPPNKMKFVVDGKVFSPDLPPRQLTLGAVEEWKVKVNMFEGHPFHIHVNPFEVLEPDGRRYWKDTLFVPRGRTVTLRSRYDRYIGRFVLHCHILDHEDMGMMQMVEIVPPGGNAHQH